MTTEICDKCGQHIPCREVCIHCGVAQCEVKGAHAAHWHKSCARNAELPAHWGGPVGAVPVMVGDRQWLQTAPVNTMRASMPQQQHTGQLPNMQALTPGHQHVSPANPASPTVVTQGSEPPGDLSPEVLASLK